MDYVEVVHSLCDITSDIYGKFITWKSKSSAVPTAQLPGVENSGVTNDADFCDAFLKFDHKLKVQIIKYFGIAYILENN